MLNYFQKFCLLTFTMLCMNLAVRAMNNDAEDDQSVNARIANPRDALEQMVVDIELYDSIPNGVTRASEKRNLLRRKIQEFESMINDINQDDTLSNFYMRVQEIKEKNNL